MITVLLSVLVAISMATAVNAEPADTVALNGKIYTVNPRQPWDEAIAIRGEKILAVGREDKVRAAAGQSVEVIDLNGRVVLPGFVDPHTHMMSGSLVASVMEYVGVAKFSTTAEVLKHLRGIAAETAAALTEVGRVDLQVTDIGRLPAIAAAAVGQGSGAELVQLVDTADRSHGQGLVAIETLTRRTLVQGRHEEPADRPVPTPTIIALMSFQASPKLAFL